MLKPEEVILGFVPLPGTAEVSGILPLLAMVTVCGLLVEPGFVVAKCNAGGLTRSSFQMVEAAPSAKKTFPSPSTATTPIAVRPGSDQYFGNTVRRIVCPCKRPGPGVIRTEDVSVAIDGHTHLATGKRTPGVASVGLRNVHRTIAKIDNSNTVHRDSIAQQRGDAETALSTYLPEVSVAFQQAITDDAQNTDVEEYRRCRRHPPQRR